MEQRRLLPHSAPWPQCWNMSDNLANAEHVDPDGHRSFAIWLAKRGHAGVSGGWWFLFPRHGVTVELCNGCWVS